MPFVHNRPQIARCYEWKISIHSFLQLSVRTKTLRRLNAPKQRRQILESSSRMRSLVQKQRCRRVPVDHAQFFQLFEKCEQSPHSAQLHLPLQAKSRIFHFLRRSHCQTTAKSARQRVRPQNCYDTLGQRQFLKNTARRWKNRYCILYNSVQSAN